MKKLFVLVAALLLVGLLASADEPYEGGMGGTISGKVEYRAKSDLEDETFANDSVVELKFDGMVENGQVYIEFEEGASTLAGAGLADVNAFDRAWFLTDVGMALGLPIGINVKVGYEEFKNKDGIKVTAGEYEDILGGYAFTTWGYQIDAMVVEDLATLRLSFGGDWDTEEMNVGVYGTYDPVTYEVFYQIDTDTEPGDGAVEAGAEYNGEVSGFPLGVAALVDYNLGTEVWEIGFGADTTVAEMLRVGLGWRGMKDAEAGALQVDLTAMPPIDLDVEVNLFLGLALDEGYGAETFDSAEFSVKLVAGADWYIGYFWVAENGTGGAIAKEKVELDPDGLKESAIFLRAVMAF